MSITNDTVSPSKPRIETRSVPTPVSFPPDFLWGAATSAYQIEGAVHEDGRAPSMWDPFAAVPGATYQGQTGEIAVDHYHRMEDDVALMAELNLSIYRFSLSWPRILPQGTGAVNERGLDFYDRLVDTLLARGIRPLATLYHWDLPVILQDRGGWLVRDTAYAFADYAGVVVRRLGDRVHWWLTHNEPWCSAYLGYAIGIHAPGLHDKQLAVEAGHHVLLAHGLSVARLRAHLSPQAQVGIALDFYPVYAADDRPETLLAVKSADTFRNRWFLDPLLLGRYPHGLFTEIGAAFDDHGDGNNHIHDQQRIDYLRAHIQTVARVMNQGVPIKGYVVWSLLDNFEWSEGYRKRFGLVYVDYPTLRRVVKDSGHWYASFVASARGRSGG